MAKIAVVVTVLNEKQTIQELLAALRGQVLRPQEVVIVDGGSVDGTWDILQQTKGIKCFRQPGNRSVGRNYGVARTRSPLIAFTDAGCTPQPDWLGELIKPFSGSTVQIVSGYYKGLPKSIFEKCLVPYVLVMPDRVPAEFFPASRSMALRRSVWQKSGGFNERNAFSEDFEFAHKLKGLGYRFTFASQAIVGWRPRQNLKEAAWMFLRFAIGDVHAGILRPKVKLLAIRYYLFLFLVFISPLAWWLVPPYLVWAIAKNYRYARDIRAFFWLPVLQITSDIMVLFGTIVGALSKIK